MKRISLATSLYRAAMTGLLRGPDLDAGTAADNVRAHVPAVSGSQLADLAQIMGGRDAAICRELTKLHEEIKRAPIAELAKAADQLETRGEFVLVPTFRLPTLIHTRSGNAIGPRGKLDLQVTNRDGVPASGVGAVILNVTAINLRGVPDVLPPPQSFLSVFPTDRFF